MSVKGKFERKRKYAERALASMQASIETLNDDPI